MATIYREFEISATPEAAWEALRDIGRINTLLTFLGDVTVEGDRRRCALGAEGQLDELIVSVDDDRRRIAYAVKASPFNFEHHHASMQIDPNGDDGSRFTWISDVKPDESASPLAGAIDVAVESFKRTLT